MNGDTTCKTGQSWRFIHDPVVFREKTMWVMLFGGFIWALFAVALSREFQASLIDGTGILTLVLICLLCGGTYYFCMKGKSFVIDRQGIRFSWHFRAVYRMAWQTHSLPRAFDWSVIEVIRLIPDSMPLTAKSLAFRINGARAGLTGGQDVWFILPIVTWVGETYIGDGHACSLMNTLSAAQGCPIKEIRADEIDRISLMLGQRVIRAGKDDGVPLAKRNLGKRFLWVALTIPAVIVVGAMIVASVEESPILLKVSGFMASDVLIPGGGILLAFAAGFYLRKEGNEGVAFLLCLLLGGAGSFFLFMPVTYSLPEWLGEATKERFSVIHADKVCQEWRGIGAPELSFSLYAEPEKRRYPEIGAEWEFTVHRGPLRLVSIPGKEFGGLYEKDAKISYGICAPGAPEKIRQNQKERSDS
ncbi:MAG: hypothetical protein LBF51_05310 [Zoogloeaceae bacterium]|jgi:hypothetical protein|nr:hypothetical protein [Zoogloeaceae bacterium]